MRRTLTLGASLFTLTALGCGDADDTSGADSSDDTSEASDDTSGGAPDDTSGDDCVDPDDYGVPGLCEEVSQLPDWSDPMPWHTGDEMSAMTETSATLEASYGLSQPLEVVSGAGYGTLVYNFSRNCSYTLLYTAFLVEASVTLEEYGVTLTDAQQIKLYDDPDAPEGTLWLSVDAAGTPWEGEALQVGVHYTAEGIDSVVGTSEDGCLRFRAGSSDPWLDLEIC